MKIFHAALAFLVVASAGVAIAQTPPTYQNAGGTTLPTPAASVMGLDSVTGEKCFIGGSSTCVMPSSGGGGGGGGDASAANQATQITAANLTNTTLGAVTASPTTNTIGDRLKAINTTLGTPFQAGGSIGNTSFTSTQSGTWTVQPGNTANTTPWLVTATGNVASGATDSGNPVKVGCVFLTTTPTLTDGQRGDCQAGTRGSMRVEIIANNGTTGASVSSGGSDAVSNTNGGLIVYSRGNIFNGTTYDRGRSVIDATNSIGTGITAVGLVAQLDDTSPTTITENQFGNLRMSPNRALIVKPYATGSQDWAYAAASGGISNTTNPVLLVAATASLRNYLNSCQISSDALGAATELVIRDGSAGTVLTRMKINTAGLSPTNIEFPMPLKSSVNTLLEVATLTATVTGGIYINCQGYTAL